MAPKKAASKTKAKASAAPDAELEPKRRRTGKGPDGDRDQEHLDGVVVGNPPAPSTPPAASQRALARKHSSPQLRTSPIHTASPKAKKLAKSGSAIARGGVLSKDEQQAFQAWLKRQRQAGTPKAMEWLSNHTNDVWRRSFHQDWKVQRDATRNTAIQTSKNEKIAQSGGENDWYTIYEFAHLEKLSPDSELCIRLFDKLEKRPNRNPNFEDDPQMQEGKYTKHSKMSWKEVNSRATESSSSTDLNASEHEALEKILGDQADNQIVPAHQQKQNKTPPKVITLENSMKKMKLLHKSMGDEKILSEGYLAKLRGCMKPWAPEWTESLQKATDELTAKTNELFALTTSEHTLEEALAINVEMDKYLSNYRRGVLAQVVALLTGPAA